MHPAPSVIAFTTFSGLGFGLLAWLGIDASPPTGWTAFAFFFIAFALAVGGLISSTFHLGRPERAIKAFSQWRTSWLSREGVCAVVALLVMGLYAAALVLADMHLHVLGWLGAVLSLLTVYATSMIYAQLKTIPRWNTPLTCVLYLGYAITGGALLSGRVGIALVLLLVMTGVQILWWLHGDGAFSGRKTTMETATGLGSIGTVRSAAHPHTAPNYLVREFIHIIGRKHTQKLRVISILLMAVVPVLLLLLPFSHVAAALAVVSHIAGVAVSRWLFFAEAEHTVGLYYGMR
ncbi:dimethyl sulfoxide reductase anchor subunit family protein [Tropicimonas sp. S265A]|uniref:dimethyl sulfoxide reductase anchor subunit family protein n=1 Tax=Tropicimonas sp. S265A TaxID=3415134 RepID=UPI003C7E80D7